MSILNCVCVIRLETPVNLTVLKRGGADVYKNGKIQVDTKQAILVYFVEQGVGCWISKRNVWDNGSNYGIKAKLWNLWERVSVKPIVELEGDHTDLYPSNMGSEESALK